MKISGITAFCCVFQSISLIAAQPEDALSLFIKHHDWQGVNTLMNGTNSPIITDQYITQARLADCNAERKCWRTCTCVFSPIIGFIASSYLNDSSYTAAFINRAGSSAIAISAERLIIHGQLKNFYNARRILLLLQQRQINPV